MLSAQHVIPGSTGACADMSSRGQRSLEDDHVGIPGRGWKISLFFLSTDFYPESQSLTSLPPHPLCQAGTSSKASSRDAS